MPSTADEHGQAPTSWEEKPRKLGGTAAVPDCAGSALMLSWAEAESATGSGNSPAEGQ